jgi:hypothetical protein
MSFGYSFGDFVASANLSYRLIRASSETRGASLEYQEAINELASMQHTFLQVGQMRPSSTLSRATINVAPYIVLSSVNLIAEFLEKTKKYREQCVVVAQVIQYLMDGAKWAGFYSRAMNLRCYGILFM